MEKKKKQEKLVADDKIAGRPIRLNVVRLATRQDRPYAEVVFFGDLHLGSPECDLARAKRMLAYCEENGVYVFLMGDLVDNANRYSVGAGVYEATMTPQEQLEQVVELLAPLAAKQLILGNLAGNHEDRLFKETGVNLTKVISKMLGAPYLGAACWSLFRVGTESYRVYALHGASGSRYVHTKIKALVDISHSFEGADLLVMGHVHECADASQLAQYVSLSPPGVRERKKWLVITGHYLRYDRSYGQAKGMPIAKMGSPKVKFFGEKHDIHISW